MRANSLASLLCMSAGVSSYMFACMSRNAYFPAKLRYLFSTVRFDGLCLLQDVVLLDLEPFVPQRSFETSLVLVVCLFWARRSTDDLKLATCRVDLHWVDDAVTSCPVLGDEQPTHAS